MLSTVPAGSEPEDHALAPDVVAAEALIDAYRRLPLDPELARSAASLAALTAPE